MPLKMDELLNKAFDEAVKAAVEKAFGERWGYRDGEKITEALRGAADKMCREDPDVRARMKARLLSVIDNGEGRQ